jgi:phospholipase/carboxylesterase
MEDLTTNSVGTTGRGDRLLLLIHGYGADEYDLAPLVPHIDPDGRFFTICPRGPRSVMGFGAGWYGRSDEGPIDPVTFLASVDALDRTIDAACTEHGFTRSESVLIGFSQGGAMALAVGLRVGQAEQPAAVACLSGRLQPIEGLRYSFDAGGDSEGGTSSLPDVLVHHGTLDPVVSVEDGRAIRQALSEANVDHVYREYPMQHEINPQSVADLRHWLAER